MHGVPEVLAFSFAVAVFFEVLNSQDQRFGGSASDPAPMVPLSDGEMTLVLLVPCHPFWRQVMKKKANRRNCTWNGFHKNPPSWSDDEAQSAMVLAPQHVNEALCKAAWFTMFTNLL